MLIPNPTPIYRLLHVDNLSVYLERGGMHAPNHTPKNGHTYRTIHNVDIQKVRRQLLIPCGPQGTIHDYVSFYFGPRSPMLYQLHTGRVDNYNEGQESLIYAVSTVETIIKSNLDYVFSDGHGIAAYTQWFDDIARLNEVDWNMVYARYWFDTTDDMDRQRRKQAEFLVHQFCPFSVITNIGVLNNTAKVRVERILNKHRVLIPVIICRAWYY